MITLALSFKKPMIVDKRTRDAYNIQGIVYEKRFSEVIDTLNNDISPIVYEKLVGSISEFNKDVINKNKRRYILWQRKIYKIHQRMKQILL